MLIESRDLSSVKKSVEVEIPADAVTSEIDRVSHEFARHAKLPGFRSGKVPLKVVRSRYQKEIEEEVRDRLLPNFFRDVLREKGWQAVGSPALTKIDPIEPGKPLRFEAELEIKPAIELHEYRGIEVGEVGTDVTDADVDATIERLRLKASALRPIEDRAAAKDDYVIVDVKSSGEGVEARSTENYELHLGEGAPIPELVDALVGKNRGDEASFEKTFDDDAPNEEVKGKTVRYELTLKEIRVLEKPEVGDGFAKSTGLADTLAELREKLSSDIRKHREHEATQQKRKQIGDTLVDRHDFEIPETLIEEETGRSLRNYARYLASQGIDIERAEIDWEKMRTDFWDEAAKRVKRSLILEAIARKETLEVSDLEVDADIRKAANASQREFAELKHRLRDDGGYEEMRSGLLQEKALDFLLAESRNVRA